MIDFTVDGLHIRYERRPSAAPGTKEDRVSGCAKFPHACHGRTSICSAVVWNSAFFVANA